MRRRRRGTSEGVVVVGGVDVEGQDITSCCVLSVHCGVSCTCSSPEPVHLNHLLAAKEGGREGEGGLRDERKNEEG